MKMANGFEKEMLLKEGEKIYKKLDEAPRIPTMGATDSCSPSWHNPVVERLNDLTPAVGWLVQYRVLKERSQMATQKPKEEYALKFGKLVMTYRAVIIVAVLYLLLSIHGYDPLKSVAGLLGTPTPVTIK